MPISIHTIGDQCYGEAFKQWVDEFAYAMGAHIDLDAVQLDKPDTLVLILVYLPPDLGGFHMVGTSHRRSTSEYCSTVEVDHASFLSANVSRGIDAIKQGLMRAVEQVPTSRMSSDDKERFNMAAEHAAIRLFQDPSRHPKKPKLT